MRHRTRHIGLIAIIVFCVAGTFKAHALTFDQIDGFALARDGLGNEWLSPTATDGLSFNQALASTYVVDRGFAPATQIDSLLTAFLLPTTTTSDKQPNGIWDQFDFESGIGIRAKNFIVAFGTTLAVGGLEPQTFTSGYLAPTGGGIGVVTVGLFVTNGTNFGGVFNEPGLGVPPDTVSSFRGTWLFRSTSSSSVPEPLTASLGLMGLGVLGMATRRRTAQVS